MLLLGCGGWLELEDVAGWLARELELELDVVAVWLVGGWLDGVRGWLPLELDVVAGWLVGGWLDGVRGWLALELELDVVGRWLDVVRGWLALERCRLALRSRAHSHTLLHTLVVGLGISAGRSTRQIGHRRVVWYVVVYSKPPSFTVSSKNRTRYTPFKHS